MRNFPVLFHAFILSVVLFSACGEKEFSLRWALRQAGDNRAELEKVLDHYRGDPADSLKYRAAAYLIANMPGHISYEAGLVDAFCDRVDSVMRIPMDSSLLELAKTDLNLARNRDWETFKVPAIEKISEDYPFADSSLRQDIRVLTADYLIRNIDDAFDCWEHSPWAAHLDFDRFCEFILPYKVEDPFLADDWRAYCREFCDSIRDLGDMQYCQYYKNSVHWATRFVNEALLQNVRIIGPYSYKGSPWLRMSTFMKKHFVACEEKGIVCTAVMRSIGLPVALDYIPHWPTIYPGHAWCSVLIDANGHQETFEVLEGIPGEVQRPGEVMIKVYRKSYAIDPLLYRINHSGEDVPPFLQNYFLKDVTDKYMSTRTVGLNVPGDRKRKRRFAYLSMFDSRHWTPIACGEVDGSDVRFDKVCYNAAYLPVFYSAGVNLPFSYPFTVDAKGRVEFMEPDTSDRQQVTLYRKYPSHYHVYNTAKRLQGGKFQAANRSDFSDSVTVHEFRDWCDPSGEIDLRSDTAKYRYWRFLSPPESYNQMAEAMFFPAGDTVPNGGRTIGTRGSRTGDKAGEKEAMFDGDPFTFFDAYRSSGDWAGIDFGKEVSLDRILYVYRSDDNNIRIGDEYELFYWKDADGWASLGRQKARDIKLVFDRVPRHALYLLRDYTRGREERIFTIEEGKQVWW